MRTLLVALAAFLVTAPAALAQKWAEKQLTKPEQEVTLQDVKSAFEAYYKKHPVDLKKDRLSPTFKVTASEAREEAKIEEYNLFKRWEWFAEPRMYPLSRWDFEKIDVARANIVQHDREMLMAQRAANPLNLTFATPGPFATPAPIYPRTAPWTPMGPFDAVGGTNLGRVNCIEFDPLNSNTIYIGAADGGVWKTTDSGVTWAPKFDIQPTLSIGDIAIDRANPQIVYAATGDAFGYNTPFWGGTYSVGVRKSTDGGNTWAPTGLIWTVGQNRIIRRLVIHPTDGRILLAATSNGLYRTIDAGATWAQVWATSTFDAEFQHNDGNIVYATTTQVFKSTNGGATFAQTGATCAGARYNIEIARSNPSVLYTLCTDGTVQKSTDAGATWAATPVKPPVNLIGYYDNVLAVSPVNEKTAYVAGVSFTRTTDGGATWSGFNLTGHIDNHALKFLPGSNTTILSGNDGGLFQTGNSGTTWTSLNKGLAITQFYRLDVARTDSTVTLAGAQDNGNMKCSSDVWSKVTASDGTDGFIDWSNANVMYAAMEQGRFWRVNIPSGGGVPTYTDVRPRMPNPIMSDPWVVPWSQDPVTANTIYAGTGRVVDNTVRVYKSTNQGTNWTPISGVLSGVSAFTVLEVAPSNPKFIYAGGGTKLYKTTNAGGTWKDVTAGLPVAANYLTDIAVHDYDPTQVYVTFSGYNDGQKVYKTCNGGGAWANISGTLPNMPANTIVHQKTNNGLYVGTDAGVYYLNDDLTNWVPYKEGLPNVIVDDLEIDYSAKKVLAATYGRGVWQAPLL